MNIDFSILPNTMQTTQSQPPIKLTAGLIFLIALILRIGYVYSMEIDMPFRADAGKYFKLALNLANNGAYSMADSPPFTPSTLITPGYPAFLSLIIAVSDDLQQFYQTVLLSQAVLSSLTVLLAFYLAFRIGGLATACLAGLLIALSPQLVIGAGYILTETLSCFLITLSVVITIVALSRQTLLAFAICGVLWACAALVRPAVILFPALILLIAWWTGQQRRNCLVLAVVCFILWSPWQWWQSVNKQPDEASLAAAALALGGYPDLIFKDPTLQAYPYREDPQYETMSKSVKAAAATILERAATAPLKYLRWFLLGKPMMYWQAEEIAGPGGPYVYHVKSSIYSRQPIPAATLTGMMSIHPILALLAACAGLYSLWELAHRRKSAATEATWLCCAALMFYFTALHSVLAPLPRYAFPLYPVAYVLAAGIVGQLATQIKERFNENV